jgi:dihydrofolate reductase
MTIALFVSVADNDVIGDSNLLPWRMVADMRRFTVLTTGHTIIMGRRTHESTVAIRKARLARRGESTELETLALPNRRNIIISHQPNYTVKDCEVAHSLEEALELAKDDGEVLILGGASVYKQALPYSQKIYLTEVHGTPEGDATFPFDHEEWKEVSREDHKADEKNQFDYSFVVLERK